MKVPGSCSLTEPQERSAEPKVEEKNSAKEARGLRYAEAAEELGTAGAAVAWAAFGVSPRSDDDFERKHCKEQFYCKQTRVH